MVDGSFIRISLLIRVPGFLPAARIACSEIEAKMACLLPTTFTVPFPMLLLNKGVHRLDFAVGSSETAISTAQKIDGSCNSNKRILSVKGRCQHCLMSIARFLHETFCNDLDVDYCTETVISGYWVGPDADDGWGFVEAVINQMT